MALVPMPNVHIMMLALVMHARNDSDKLVEGRFTMLECLAMMVLTIWQAQIGWWKCRYGAGQQKWRPCWQS